MNIKVDSEYKLNNISKINNNIVHDNNSIDSFDTQLLSLASGNLDPKFPMIINQSVASLSYINKIDKNAVIAIDVSVANQIKDNHPDSYMFLSKVDELLNNGILAFTMDFNDDSNYMNVLVNETFNNNPIVIGIAYNDDPNKPIVYIDNIIFNFEKDSVNNLIVESWKTGETFYKNNDITNYLDKNSWLDLPDDLVPALYYRNSDTPFNKFSDNYEEEINRIDKMIVESIVKNEYVCGGFCSSNIVSNIPFVNNLVNIRRMDSPLEFISLLETVLVEDDIDDLLSKDKYRWQEDPILESDVQANMEAMKLNIINGFYDFTDWDIKIKISEDNISLQRALNELEYDGVIAKTKHNDNILHLLGLSDDDLRVFLVEDTFAYEISANTDSFSSENQISFNNYCKNKILSLDKTEDVFGNLYPTIMKCVIDDEECSIVYVKNKVNSLCWIDNNQQLHIDNNNAPDLLAAQMSFDSIDKDYLSSLNEFWNDLRLDEAIDIYQSRADINKHVIDKNNTSDQKQMFIDYCKNKLTDTIEFNYIDDDVVYTAYTGIKTNLRTSNKDNDSLALSECWTFEVIDDEDSYDYCNYVIAEVFDNSDSGVLLNSEEKDVYSTLMVDSSVLAAQMSFDLISKRFYDDILKYWDDLNMDELINDNLMKQGNDYNNNGRGI